MKSPFRLSLLAAGLLAIILAACSDSPTLVPAPFTGAPTPISTSTPLPSPTAAPILAPSPTAPAPTPTAIPTPTPPPSFVPVLTLGSGTLQTLAASPDGGIIAVGGSGGIWLYDSLSLEVLAHLTGHAGEVSSLAWSPDGNRLLSGGQDGTARVWDTAGDSDTAYQQIHLLAGHSANVRSAVWSPDGTRLASGGEDGIIQIWDAETGAILLTLSHPEQIHTLDWHPGGGHLLMGDFAGALYVVDPENGDTLLTLEAYTSWINNAKWSPDGAALTAVSADNNLTVWDVTFRGPLVAASERHTTQSFTHFTALAWTPDSHHFVTAGAAPYALTFWDAATGEQTHTLPGHTKWVNGLAWLPTGTLASISEDNSLRFWDPSINDPARARELRGLPTTASPYASRAQTVAWHPAGATLASGHADDTVRIWDTATGAQLHTLIGHRENINAVAWSADGQWLASASNDTTLRIWDSETGEELRVLKGEGGRLNAVAWDPYGTRVATGGLFRIVQIWDAATGEPPLRLFIDEEIASLAWSPSGTLLAIGTTAGTVRIWDLPSNIEIAVLETERTSQILALAWSPDNAHLAALNFNGALTQWYLSTGETTYTASASGLRRALAWNPQHPYLAAGSDNTTLYLLDPETGAPLHLLAGHTANIHSLAWDAEGERLASGSADGTIKIWQLGGELPRTTHLPPAADPPPPTEDNPPASLIAVPLQPANVAELAQLGQIGRGAVTRLALHPHAEALALATGAGTWLYSASGETIRHLPGNKIYGLAWSPDGGLLATRELQTIIVFDAATGQPTHIFPAGLGVQNHLAWSPDGGMLAGGDLQGAVRVWSVSSGTLLREWQTGARVNALAWSPDGRYLAATGADPVTGEGRVWPWHVAGDEAYPPLTGHTLDVSHLAWSPDGNTLLTAGDDQTLRLWDMTIPLTYTAAHTGTHHPHQTLDRPNADPLLGLAWSPDGGQFLAADTAAFIHIWDHQTLEIFHSIENYPSTALDIRWGANQATLGLVAFGSEPRVRQLPASLAQGGSIDAPHIELPPHPGEIRALTCSPAAPECAAVDELGNRHVFDISGELLFSNMYLPEPFADAVYSPDGTILAMRRQDGFIRLWDMAQRSLLTSLGAETAPSLHQHLTWSPDGNLLVWNNADQHLEFWDAAANMLTTTFKGPNIPITSIAWSPSGAKLATSGSTGEVLLWDAATGDILRVVNAYSSRTNTAAWSPDGRVLATGGSDGYDNNGTQYVRLWSVINGGLIRGISLPFGHEALSLAWSPDGTLLAVGDSFGGLQILSSAGGTLIQLDAHTQDVTSLAWASDGTLLFSGSEDGTVKVWGVEQ